MPFLIWKIIVQLVYYGNRIICTTKLPSPWTSKTPECYKRNTVNGDVHRSKRISPNFVKKIPLIKEKFMKADYPLPFVNNIVNKFQNGNECGDGSFIIPPGLF